MRMNRRRFVEMMGIGTAGALVSRRLLAGTAGAGPADPAHDALRPEYHLLAPHNWMNDPNGPIWWKGNYHLFYQMNPHAAVWGDMHWGHAVSRDMIRWQHMPIALAPTPNGADSDGCFSGSAVVLDGVPTFIYTGVQKSAYAQAIIRDSGNLLRETQMLATAEDDRLERWKKVEQPVISAPPPEMEVTGFRDPFPWQEEDGWYLGVGSGERGKGGCVLLYRSQDLRSWEYLHPLIEGKSTGQAAVGPVESGEMWECPDFFPLGDRHCLLYSTEGKVFWTTGAYDRKTHRYTASREGILDQGAYYAPKSFAAPDGRRVLWGWIQETRPQAEFAAAGWAGAMALPRVLTLDTDGHLKMAVAEEAGTLRGKRAGCTVTAAKPFRRRLETLRQELRLECRNPGDGFRVRLVKEGATVWELSVDAATGRVQCGERSFALQQGKAASSALRLFLDGSVVETLLNGSEAITSRVYGIQPGAVDLEVSVDGAARAEMELWELNAISRDRLTTG